MKFKKDFLLKGFIVNVILVSVLFADIPSRVILNLTENPATEMAVTWRTMEKVDKPVAHLTKATADTKFGDAVKELPAKTEILKVDDTKTCYQHSIILKNLNPETTYAYRVGTKENWSEWNHFTTASKQEKNFRFVYLGDVQNGIYTMTSRVLRAAYKQAPDARFWLYAGDIVNIGENDDEWQEYFDAIGWIGRTTPMVFLPGNHEYPRKIVDGKKTRVLNHLWRPQFTLPENGVEGLEETAYYIDYEDVKIVTLNGNEKLEEQANWLDDLLAKNDKEWIIVSTHQPFYNTASGRSGENRRELFLPIFDKYGVDLVLQGHDHAYGRSYKLKNNKVVDDSEPGTYYVVSVAGTKVYNMKEENKKYMAKMANGKQLFQVIDVTEDKLIYNSYDATGDHFDSFEIKK